MITALFSQCSASEAIETSYESVFRILLWSIPVRVFFFRVTFEGILPILRLQMAELTINKSNDSRNRIVLILNPCQLSVVVLVCFLVIYGVE